MHRIDLNCDLGEGGLHDEELLALVTSANVACGGHAGDRETMRRTVEAARANGVAIGAHPGFKDRSGFGRRPMALSPDEVFDLVVEQVEALREVADPAGVALQHVKPHGALYNMAATDPGLADAIARAAGSCDPELVLFGLAGSELIVAGQRNGLRTAAEAFADRTYDSDGTLTPRDVPGAVLEDQRRAVEQALRLVTDKKVTSRDGDEIKVSADTICIHGDTAGAVEFARAIRSALDAAGIDVRSIRS